MKPYVCSDCIHFDPLYSRCDFHFPECKGAGSVAADECGCLTLHSGAMPTLDDESAQLSLDL